MILLAINDSGITLLQNLRSQLIISFFFFFLCFPIVLMVVQDARGFSLFSSFLVVGGVS